jgi:hypothetical protein
MREMGVFRFKRGDLELEMSQVALARSAAPALPSAPISDEERAARREARERREEILEHAHVEGIPPDMDLEAADFDA